MDPIANEPDDHSEEKSLGAVSEGINPLPYLLKWLGDHRDGFLVAGAALYGLGYLVWSYTAWRSGRGLLPALELQYIVAGFVPAIIILLGWTGISLFYRIRDKLLALPAIHRGWVRVIAFAGLVGSTLAIGVQAATSAHLLNLGWTAEEISRRTSPLALIFFYVAILTKDPIRRSKGWNRAVGLYRYLIGAMFVYYGVLLYLDLYPRLPQELGGPEPRSAYVDMIVKEVSKDTLVVLVPANASLAVATTEAPEVVRSKRLQVFFSSSDYLLVRPASDENGQDLPQDRGTPLYELKKEVIRAVTWSK